jgi:quinolinate synthase
MDAPLFTRAPQTPQTRTGHGAEAEAETDMSPQVAAARERLRGVIPDFEWALHAPYLEEIARLKEERQAVILAHNYQTPEIFYGAGDFRGDSLQLAKEAAKVDAPVILQAGVHFMAETSKILAPEKTVLIPDLRAGCSLASSITGEDVRGLKRRYPGRPVVTYVNTSADVKAESDICCTSSNAVEVVESLGVEEVILIPDEYLAKNVARQTDVRIITWAGRCEVHERFSADDIEEIRGGDADVKILAHPECPPDVLAASDFAGSTAALIDYVKRERPKKAALITECSMSDNVAAEAEGTELVRPCNLCPHMKRITLPKIATSLRTMTHEVHVDPEIAARARNAVQAMVDLELPAHKRGFATGERAARDVHVEVA